MITNDVYDEALLFNQLYMYWVHMKTLSSIILVNSMFDICWLQMKNMIYYSSVLDMYCSKDWCCMVNERLIILFFWMLSVGLLVGKEI